MASAEPLNEVDVALLGLQRDDRPWAVHFEVELHEPLNRDETEAGVRHALVRHPRAAASLDVDGPRPTWRLGAFGVEDLVSDDDRPAAQVRPLLLDRPFRLDSEPPIRVARLEAGARLLVVVNHAVTDGLGGARFVHELLVGTAMPDTGEVERSVPSGLAGRLARRHRLASARSALSTARHVLGGGSSTSTDPREPTTIVAAVLDAETRRRLIGEPPPGLGVNDVMLAATHLALHDVVGTSPSERVAVSVPVDLRRHVGSPPGMGNGIVSALTASRRRSTTDRRRLAASLGKAVRHQAEPGRLAGTVAMFVWGAGQGRRRPSRPAGRFGWPDTAVFSNLGDLDPFGSGWNRVRSLTFTPPAHDLVSVGVVSAAGSTTIAVRQRGAPTETAALVDAIVDHIGRLLGGES